MATYNGEKYLEEQLKSILCQLAETDEVIISDDGSGDGTVELIKSYKDSRIHLFDNRRQKGIIGNFENALSYASGDFIFLADQDDVWLPGKVKSCVEALQHYDLILHDAFVVDEKLSVIHPSFFCLRGVHSGFYHNLLKNSYIGCCMAFKRSLLNNVLPFPSGIAMHDMWIGLKAELQGKVGLLPESLLLYRRHSSNASFTGEMSKFSWMYRLWYRLKMIKYLTLS